MCRLEGSACGCYANHSGESGTGFGGGRGEIDRAQDLEGVLPTAVALGQGSGVCFMSSYPGFHETVLSVLYTFRIFAWPFKSLLVRLGRSL